MLKTHGLTGIVIALLITVVSCKPSVSLDEYRKPSADGASLVSASANGEPLTILNDSTDLKSGDVVFDLAIKTVFKPEGLKFKHFVVKDGALINYQTGIVQPNDIKRNGEVSTFKIKTNIPKDFEESLLRIGDFGHEVIFELMIKPELFT